MILFLHFSEFLEHQLASNSRKLSPPKLSLRYPGSQLTIHPGLSSIKVKDFTAMTNDIKFLPNGFFLKHLTWWEQQSRSIPKLIPPPLNKDRIQDSLGTSENNLIKP